MKQRKTKKEKQAIKLRKNNSNQSSFTENKVEVVKEKKMDDTKKEVTKILKGERKIDFSYIRRDLTKSLALTMLALGIEIGLWYLWR
jgi:hypothetical protein